MENKIKFNVFLPFYSFGNIKKKSKIFNTIKNVVLECENLGYHSVFLDDHLMYEKDGVLECWSTLSALSSITKKIRLGTMATCNSFRNPALLAKICATVDNISKGRLEFGIGAGIQKIEHIAYGYSFPFTKIRIEKMNEAIEIIKKMWTEESPEYKGKYYQILNPVCEPRPVQKPHPPITVCGGGEKYTLKVTARHGNRYDWGYIQSFEAYKNKVQVLKNHCKKVGRDFDNIEKSCWPVGQIFMDNNRFELKKRAINFLPKDVTLKEFTRTNFIGSPKKFFQEIQKYLNLGVTHFMLFFGDLPNLRGLRCFAKEFINQQLR